MPSSWETCMVLPLQRRVIMTLFMCKMTVVVTVYKYQIWKTHQVFLCLYHYLVRQLNGNSECPADTKCIYLDWFNIHSWIFWFSLDVCLCLLSRWCDLSSPIQQCISAQFSKCLQYRSSHLFIKVCFILKRMYVCVHQYFYLNPIQCKLSLALFCLSLNYIEIISTLFRNDLRAASITVWYHHLSFLTKSHNCAYS